MFSQYKDVLGIPGKGVHTHVLGVAIGDVIMTILGAYLFHRFTGYTFWKCLLGLFILGIILHRLFAVRTTLDKLLFGGK
jgi:hypothetical protein